MSGGLLVEFADAETLRRAVRHCRNERIGRIETHTPRAPDEAGRSPLPLVVTVAAVAGAGAAFTAQWYVTAHAGASDIGGRPPFSWPAYVPLTVAGGLLWAVLAGFFGFLIACRLPALHDPLDEIDGFRRATRDGWFLAVRTTDAAVIGRVKAVLPELRPLLVEELP